MAKLDSMTTYRNLLEIRQKARRRDVRILGFACLLASLGTLAVGLVAGLSGYLKLDAYPDGHGYGGEGHGSGDGHAATTLAPQAARQKKRLVERASFRSTSIFFFNLG